MGYISATVHNGRDDTIVLLLTSDGDPIADLSGVTRVVVHLDASTSVDSDVAGSSVIWWTDQVTWPGDDHPDAALYDALKLRLGGQSLTAGEYNDVEIVVYDADHTNGVTYDEKDIRVEVEA